MVSYWKEPQETGELCSNKTFRTDTRLECHVILTCYQTWFSLGIFFNHCKIYIKSSYLIILYDKPYKTWQGLDLASGLQFADPGAKTHAPCGHGSVTGCNCSVHPCWHIAGAQDVCVGWTRERGEEGLSQTWHTCHRAVPMEAQETHETCLGPHWGTDLNAR